MFSSHSTVFGIYSRRALMTMVLRVYEALESLFSFLYHHQLELGLYPVIVLSSWWFLHAQGDPPTTSEQGQNEYSTCRPDSGSIQVNDASKQAVRYCQTLPSQSSIGEGSIPPTNSGTNRSLNDSIWATPTKTSIEFDKTPTQKSYSQKMNQVQVQRGGNELCSNQAVRAEKPNLEEKMKAFERKNMGISPCLAGSLQVPQNGPRVRRNRSYPRLRHSVLTWWAGVEQDQAAGQEPPTESQNRSDLEEASNCSVCEVIQPWDSWSAATHNLRSANDQNNTRTKSRRIFTNFDPATMVSRTHDIA
ncbi:hypothetical protein JOM56_003322 [Amanita muscaria]